MTHPDIETLSAFIDNEIDAENARRVELHLRECMKCKRLVEEFALLGAETKAALFLGTFSTELAVSDKRRTRIKSFVKYGGIAAVLAGLLLGIAKTGSEVTDSQGQGISRYSQAHYESRLRQF